MTGSLLIALLLGCQHAHSAPGVQAPQPPTAQAPVVPPGVHPTTAPAPAAPLAPRATIDVESAAVPRRSMAPAETVAVGKWPEGLVVTEEGLWVAESGARRVTRYGLHGEAGRPSRVGRLPVDLARAADGRLVSLVATDRAVVAIDPASGRVAPIATMPDYPEALCTAGDALWVLLYEGGSSIDSSVVRVDLTTGAQLRSGRLGPNAHGIAFGAGKVWVANAAGLTALDPVSLAVLGQLPLSDRPMEVLASHTAVYVATGAGVVRVDPARLEVTHRLALGERVGVLSRFGEGVAAFGAGGTLWLLSADGLAPRIALTGEPFEPRAASALGDALYVTTHRGRGDGGSVLVLRPNDVHP